MLRMPVSQGCLCVVKYLMFVFNLIFWLGGCGLFGVGVWLSFTQSEFSSLPLSFPSLSAANLLLVAGGITMITGFLGCLGALKEQRCLLFTFFLILLLLVLTEVTLVLVIHIFHDQLDSKAQKELKEDMKMYESDSGLKNSWDNVQKMFKCCGVTNKTDWYNVLKGKLPLSCCSVGTQTCVEGWTEHVFLLSPQLVAAESAGGFFLLIGSFSFPQSPKWLLIEPCYQKARKWLIKNITSVLVFGVCIGVVQILALVFSMLMYCQILSAEKHLD